MCFNHLKITKWSKTSGDHHHTVSQDMVNLVRIITVKLLDPGKVCSDQWLSWENRHETIVVNVVTSICQYEKHIIYICGFPANVDRLDRCSMFFWWLGGPTWTGRCAFHWAFLFNGAINCLQRSSGVGGILWMGLNMGGFIEWGYN